MKVLLLRLRVGVKERRVVLLGAEFEVQGTKIARRLPEVSGVDWSLGEWEPSVTASPLRSEALRRLPEFGPLVPEPTPGTPNRQDTGR